MNTNREKFVRITSISGWSAEVSGPESTSDDEAVSLMRQELARHQYAADAEAARFDQDLAEIVVRRMVEGESPVPLRTRNADAQRVELATYGPAAGEWLSGVLDAVEKL